MEWGGLGATRKQKKVELLNQRLVAHQNKLQEDNEDSDKSIANKEMKRSDENGEHKNFTEADSLTIQFQRSVSS